MSKTREIKYTRVKRGESVEFSVVAKARKVFFGVSKVGIYQNKRHVGSRLKLGWTNEHALARTERQIQSRGTIRSFVHEPWSLPFFGGSRDSGDLYRRYVELSRPPNRRRCR